jgi:ubiquinone/menaquinone biosynthesis C-methylase UbiE
MRPIRDPERAELNHLLSACPLEHQTVLEIGCGDGSFTRQYVRMTGKVLGIDPAMIDLACAKKKNRVKKASFIQGEAEWLPFPSRSFNIVLLASSL